MTTHERVLGARSHQEPDRVQILFGTSGVTTMNTAACDRLKARLGIARPTRSLWRALEYAVLDEAVLGRLAPVRCIQPDVPPESVRAMLNDAIRAGQQFSFWDFGHRTWGDRATCDGSWGGGGPTEMAGWEPAPRSGGQNENCCGRDAIR
jgi:hypothetical protein